MEENKAGEAIESFEESSPKPDPNSSSGDKNKAPEVEVHLFRRGRGPIDVFRSKLGGWDQDRLEVQDILDKYGFKSLFAFNPESGRGVPIRFSSRNGRSILPYTGGSVVVIDGEPKVIPLSIVCSSEPFCWIYSIDHDFFFLFKKAKIPGEKDRFL